MGLCKSDTSEAIADGKVWDGAAGFAGDGYRGAGGHRPRSSGLIDRRCEGAIGAGAGG